MGTIYDELKPVANSLLKEFNQGVLKYVKNVKSDAGSDDEPATLTPTLFSIDGTVSGAKFKYVQSGQALASDLQTTISTVGTNEAGVEVEIIPDMKDFIQVDNVKYKIVKIFPKPAAGVTVANVLIIRK